MHIRLLIDSYTVATLKSCTNFNLCKPSTGEYPCVYSQDKCKFLASDQRVVVTLQLTRTVRTYVHNHLCISQLQLPDKLSKSFHQCFYSAGVCFIWVLIFRMLCMSQNQWWRDMRGQTTCALMLGGYTVRNVICAYIAQVQLASIL